MPSKISPKASFERHGRGGQSRMTTPSALSKVASRHLLDAQPPLLSEEGTTFRFLPLRFTRRGKAGCRVPENVTMLGCPMYDVRSYLSNDPKTKCDIWSSGHVTNTSDIVHGTSQHLTLQSNNQTTRYCGTGGLAGPVRFRARISCVRIQSLYAS